MELRKFIIELTKNQVKPALGCTEIGIVALSCAKAISILKDELSEATIWVSPYVYRNDARVGVPQLGRCGLKKIAASGFVLKNPEDGLALLEKLDSQKIKEIEALDAKEIITVKTEYKCDPVYTKVIAKDVKNNVAEVIIDKEHDHISFIRLNDSILLDSSSNNIQSNNNIDFNAGVRKYSLKEVWKEVKKIPESDLGFLKKGINMNKLVCEEGLKNPDPTSISKVWQKMLNTQACAYGFDKNHWSTQLLGYICSAVDARMYGCPLPVMSSSNSGDHGLTVTIPLQIHANFFKEKFNINETKLLRSMIFAHYVTFYIKSHMGHLSAMCGSAVAAAAATICGIAYQREFNWSQINNLLNMHITGQVGVICDGAKPSCSYKIMASLVTGFLALTIIESGGKICDFDGIVCPQCEDTIRNLESFSSKTKNDTTAALVDILEKNDQKIK